MPLVIMAPAKRKSVVYACTMKWQSNPPSSACSGFSACSRKLTRANFQHPSFQWTHSANTIKDESDWGKEVLASLAALVTKHKVDGNAKLSEDGITRHFTECWNRYHTICVGGGVDKMMKSRASKASSAGASHVRAREASRFSPSLSPACHVMHAS